MAKHGKKYNATAEKIDRLKTYELNEALGLAKDGAATKFDSSVDVAVKLGVDPRKADQNIRGSVVLPISGEPPVRLIRNPNPRTHGGGQRNAFDMAATKDDVISFIDPILVFQLLDKFRHLQNRHVVDKGNDIIFRCSHLKLLSQLKIKTKRL